MATINRNGHHRLEKLTRDSHFHQNEQLDSSETNTRENESAFHPSETSLDFATAHNRLEAVGLFLEDVGQIEEEDYGDFMRFANKRLDDLKPFFADASSMARVRLVEMQDYLQFNSNWNVESTRARLIDDARALLMLA